MKKTIDSKTIYDVLLPELLKMNVEIPDDVREALDHAEQQETGPACTVLTHIIKNIEIAGKRNMPMCQDTGLVVVFVEIGRDLLFAGEVLDKVINRTIEDSYSQGYFRKSIVGDPLKERMNTGNNLPAVIYYEYTEGDTLKISCLAKGFGSENYSNVQMLKPTADREEVIQVVTDTMIKAKGNCCPPVYLGVGIGGTMDWAGRISKKALLRHINDPHPDPYYAELEKEMFNEVNKLGIGGGGLGGDITALSVKVETYATHIAGLPVAVSVNCWAERRAEIEL